MKVGSVLICILFPIPELLLKAVVLRVCILLPRLLHAHSSLKESIRLSCLCFTIDPLPMTCSVQRVQFRKTVLTTCSIVSYYPFVSLQLSDSLSRLIKSALFDGCADPASVAALLPGTFLYITMELV